MYRSGLLWWPSFTLYPRHVQMCFFYQARPVHTPTADTHTQREYLCACGFPSCACADGQCAQVRAMACCTAISYSGSPHDRASRAKQFRDFPLSGGSPPLKGKVPRIDVTNIHKQRLMIGVSKKNVFLKRVVQFKSFSPRESRLYHSTSLLHPRKAPNQSPFLVLPMPGGVLDPSFPRRQSILTSPASESRVEQALANRCSQTCISFPPTSPLALMGACGVAVFRTRCRLWGIRLKARS